MSEDELMAPPVDRRSSTRTAASVPVAIVSDSWAICGVVEDVSDTGALLLTLEQLKAGTRIDVYVLLGTSVQPTVKAVAKVVRSHQREAANQLWSHEVAIQFESQRGRWSDALSAVAERQASLRRTDD